MKTRILVGFIMLSFISCSSTKNQKTTTEQIKAYDDLKILAESGNFKFDAEVMYPLETQDAVNAANNLLGNFGNNGNYVGLKPGYFLKIKNDSVSTRLPYIGEMQRISLYGKTNNSGISINSSVKNYSLDSTKQKHLKVRFETSDGSESYDILIKLFANSSADMTINSSNRSIIRYRGKIRNN